MSDSEVERILGCQKDYCQVLQVSETADKKTIKKHYRQLALKVHPDKSKHPKAAAAFTALKQAYEGLLIGELKEPPKHTNHNHFYHNQSYHNHSHHNHSYHNPNRGYTFSYGFDPANFHNSYHTQFSNSFHNIPAEEILRRIYMAHFNAQFNTHARAHTQNFNRSTPLEISPNRCAVLLAIFIILWAVLLRTS
ncbi:hypothetical protein NEHOM01_0205 [Nematocida homosporus]|uniref:uncharacterized protein n=1 Tax=Nematocida homosporus TaxID=1912981 RepID=UPI00221FE35B|nr:uncharacterized protein NEHOM01_0205 [Nematocida homosporus]KAI5184530.1 hypothetical protein NEHOM01_0205 [Nematocida homosporus]